MRLVHFSYRKRHHCCKGHFAGSGTKTSTTVFSRDFFESTFSVMDNFFFSLFFESGGRAKQYSSLPHCNSRYRDRRGDTKTHIKERKRGRGRDREMVYLISVSPIFPSASFSMHLASHYPFPRSKGAVFVHFASRLSRSIDPK